MATLITVKNVNRTPLRLGSVRVPRDGTPVSVDIDDGRVRRDMYRHVGRWIVVEDAGDTAAGSPEAAIPDAIAPAALTSVGTQEAAAALTSAQITGGEDPTEGEYNFLQADVFEVWTELNDLVADHNFVWDDIDALTTSVDDLTTTVNDILAAVRAQGIVTP